MRARAAALAAVVALGAAVGCVHRGPEGFVCPGRGGPSWRELESAHFVVRTDLASKRARELARDLEATFEIVRRGLGRAAPDAGLVRVHVVAFRSAAQFDEFAPPNMDGYFFVSQFGEPVMVLPGTFGSTQRMVLAHEITHALTRSVLARAPHWLFEGLATYMETVGWTGRGRVPTLGGIAWHRIAELRPYPGGIADVLAPGARIDTARKYALAWALVHFLEHDRRAGLEQYEARLAAAEDPAAAWRAVFPEWDPARSGGAEALDLELAAHLARGDHRAREVRSGDALRQAQGERTPPVAERALTPAEAHDTRLALPRLNRGRPVLHARVMDEIREALDEDPAAVAALAALAEYSPPPIDARALALRATAGHPEDARAWLFLAQETPADDRASREALYRRATAAAPTNPIALNNLAYLLVESGRLDEALPLAQRAVAIAPWLPALVDTLAAVHEGMGRCREALSLQRRAVETLPGELAEDRRKPYVDRLARLQAGCGGAAVRAVPETPPLVPNGARPQAERSRGTR